METALKRLRNRTNDLLKEAEVVSGEIPGKDRTSLEEAPGPEMAHASA